MCSAGTVTRRAASSAEGRVWATAMVTTAASRGVSAAASSAAPPPIPCPARAVRRPSTLIFPSPSRTPTQTSSAVRRSAANRAWLGSGPRWLSGPRRRSPTRRGAAAARRSARPAAASRARTRRPADPALPWGRTRRRGPRPCRGRRAGPRAGPCRRAAPRPRARSSPRAAGRTRWWGSRCTVPPTITAGPAWSARGTTCGNEDRYSDDGEEAGAWPRTERRTDGAPDRSSASPCGGGRPLAGVIGGCSDAELDDDDLVATLRAQLASHGVQADDLRCPSGLSAEVGESVRCTFTVGGQPVDAVATISAVDGETVTYDVHTEARPVMRAVLERSVAELAQAGVPAGTASCAGDLPAQSGGDGGVHCPARRVFRTGRSGRPPSTAVRSTTPSSRQVLMSELARSRQRSAHLERRAVDRVGWRRCSRWRSPRSPL